MASTIALFSSHPTQARRLEGRPLGLRSSLLLADPSRLELLESESRLVTALGFLPVPSGAWRPGRGVGEGQGYTESSDGPDSPLTGS
jgi:hypothetical protein